MKQENEYGRFNKNVDEMRIIAKNNPNGYVRDTRYRQLMDQNKMILNTIKINKEL